MKICTGIFEENPRKTIRKNSANNILMKFYNRIFTRSCYIERKSAKEYSKENPRTTFEKNPRKSLGNKIRCRIIRKFERKSATTYVKENPPKHNCKKFRERLFERKSARDHLEENLRKNI